MSSPDAACAAAHGDRPDPTPDRRLVVVFASPVAAAIAHFAAHVGFRVLLLEPDPDRAAPDLPRVASVAEAALDPATALDGQTDVVVCDHDRPELGDVLAEVLGAPTRWVGVMGNPRHPAPHVPALRERNVPEEVIARVHRPIGLDIGSRAPAEIALSTVAGLLAPRNGRSGRSYAERSAGA